MARHEFSSKTKQAAAQRSAGCCEGCHKPFKPYEKREFDHEIECALGGDSSVENCKVLCIACHRSKTKKRAPVLAKANRVWRKANGIRKSSRLPGSRTSRWRKKLNGEVVER